MYIRSVIVFLLGFLLALVQAHAASFGTDHSTAGPRSTTARSVEVISSAKGKFPVRRGGFRLWRSWLLLRH